MEQEYSCPTFPHNLCKLNLSHCSLWPKASEKIWEAILKYEENNGFYTLISFNHSGRSYYIKWQKSTSSATGLWNRGPLKNWNDSRINLIPFRTFRVQRSSIPQTSNCSGTPWYTNTPTLRIKQIIKVCFFKDVILKEMNS